MQITNTFGIDALYSRLTPREQNFFLEMKQIADSRLQDQPNDLTRAQIRTLRMALAAKKYQKQTKGVANENSQ